MANSDAVKILSGTPPGIRLLHYLRFHARIGWIAPLKEQHAALIPAQLERLAVHAQSLADYLRLKGNDPVPDILVELACLNIASERGCPDPIVALSEKWGGFSEEKRSQAADWLTSAMCLLGMYETLPLEQRESLTQLAKDSGVELPLDAGGRPEQLLAALDQLGLVGADLDRPLLQVYRSLSPDQGRQLARDTLELWPGDPHSAWMHLACLAPGSMRDILMALTHDGAIDAPEWYRDADAETREQLIRLVETGAGSAMDALPALAWTEDEVVQALFHRLRQSPPPWDEQLGWRIDTYITRGAGWELTETGERRSLFHPECYQLVPPANTSAANVLEPVSVVTSHEEQCGWCGRQLVTLFDIDLRDPRLTFLAPGWNRLRIATCERCLVPFTEVDGEGGSHWSPVNNDSDMVGDGGSTNDSEMIGDEGSAWELPQRRLVLGQRRRSPYEAHPSVMYLKEGASQVGGFPMWVGQEPHPDCPKCQRGMVFVGQLQLWDIIEDTEGVMYAFLCQDCQMAATSYAQT